MKQHTVPTGHRNWNWAFASGGVLVIAWKLMLLAVTVTSIREPASLAALGKLRA